MKKMIPFVVFAVTMATTSFVVVLASPDVYSNSNSNNKVKPTPFPVCLDDSDCVSYGDRYACFQYFCYPWKNDKDVAESVKRKTCRENSECNPGQECYRHHDKRNINRGLCFDKILFKKCHVESDCTRGYGCCGGNCCEMEYHNKFADLPCVSSLGCQDLGMGKYCCPRSNNTNVCCDTDPNPPTTPTPRNSPATAEGNSPSSKTAILLVSVSFSLLLRAILRQ